MGTLKDADKIMFEDIKKYWPVTPGFSVNLSFMPALSYEPDNAVIKMCQEKYDQVNMTFVKLTPSKVKRIDEFIKKFKVKDSYKFI